MYVCLIYRRRSLVRIDSGEDEASLKKHREAIENELKKRDPSVEFVMARMKVTFEDRVSFIHNLNPQIESLFQHFPAFNSGFSTAVFHQEAELITKTNINLLAFLEEKSQRLIAHLKLNSVSFSFFILQRYFSS